MSGHSRHSCLKLSWEGAAQTDGTKNMRTKQDIADWLDEHETRFTRMSDEIWDNPELQFLEFNASKLQADFLAAEGFQITWDIGGLSTAFAAEWGAGGAGYRLRRRIRRPARLVAEGSERSGANQSRRARAWMRAQLAGHGLPGGGARIQGVAANFWTYRHSPLLRMPGGRRRQWQSLYGARRRF